MILSEFVIMGACNLTIVDGCGLRDEIEDLSLSGLYESVQQLDVPEEAEFIGERTSLKSRSIGTVLDGAFKVHLPVIMPRVCRNYPRFTSTDRGRTCISVGSV